MAGRECSQHPTYKGKAAPTSGCVDCWCIFFSNNYYSLSLREFLAKFKLTILKSKGKK